MDFDSSNQDSREKLRKLIRTLSYREGNFTLASGKKSTFYVDLKNTTLHPEGADLIGSGVVEALQKNGMDIDAVGGLTLGADPISTAVSLAAWQKKIVWPALIVRKEPKDHGTAKYIEGAENLKPGSRVAILEDVVTTGGSSLKAIERVREAGFKIACVVTIVDREEGGEAKFKEMGIPFIALLTLKEIQRN